MNISELISRWLVENGKVTIVAPVSPHIESRVMYEGTVNHELISSEVLNMKVMYLEIIDRDHLRVYTMSE